MSEVADKVRWIFDNMPVNLRPDKAAGMSSVLHFQLTGDDGGDFTVRIADGACTVGDGHHDTPDITVTMKAEDYVAVVYGKMSDEMAFLTGKMKIAGDFALALKVQKLFERPRE